MFNKYYQDELAYLRELGREFADQNPESAGWLAQPGADPDVERLLEGFAFLTARIRQKLDDELPELTHSMLQLYWPHYLRPIPSMTVVQFSPKAKAKAKPHTVERGAEVASKPIDGTACRYRVAYETPILPLTLEGLEVGPSSSPYLALKLAPVGGAALAKMGDRLRLHLAGTASAARSLYLTLCRYLRGIRLRTEGGEEVSLGEARIEPVGFADDEALVPAVPNSFPGFRLLQEYFSFPHKFMFVDLVGAKAIWAATGGKPFELVFDAEHFPNDMPPVDASNVRLNCSPAVNLFEHDADPIKLAERRVEYRVRPGGPTGHFEVHSVDSVRGTRRGAPGPRVYHPFLQTFRPSAGDSLLYQTRISEAVTSEGTDTTITFLEAGQPAAFAQETISIGLTCSNRGLPRSLGLGDLDQSVPGSPAFATFKNIMAPTAPVPPPLSGDLYWSLLSHQSLNYLSLLRPEALRELLRLYDFRARVDRQAERALARRLEGLIGVKHGPRLLVQDGAALRGVGVELELEEEPFGGEGEVFLFGAVMDRFLAHYVTLNSFCETSVRGKKHGEVHRWSPRTGARAIL